MTRKTVDQISDDELDALYEERDRLAAVIRRIDQMVTAWQERLPEVIRTEVAVDVIRMALEPAQRATGATDPDSRTVVAP